MVTLTLSNVKDFMNRLLLTPTFDDWGFQGAEVIALTQYSIAGTLNSRYLSEAERASRKTEGLLFSEVRKVLASIIKAGRTPSLMKMVLVCPVSLLDGHTSIGAESYLMTIHFQDGVLKVTGGISMRVFSMDRSDAQFWDAHFPKVLSRLQIAFNL